MAEHVTQSKSVENFLKAVFTLQQQEDRVQTNSLRDALGIAAPSVTDMAQRLVTAGLVDYEKYRGVVLTDAGREIALKVIRRHRLIELYLMRELGYELREVHEEAEALEHAVSDHFVEAIAHKLGNPKIDPHGDPIPSAEGVISEPHLQPLTELEPGVKATIARLKTHDDDMLQHMLDRGFRLNARVEVVERDPFNGPITTQVDGKRRVIGYRVAENILVTTDAALDSGGR
ncbi:MAG TPA: metal-dependent transcriptional regulator [Phototrophicaceae bacterium]|nr:metal-dependent transcriptional regulator [Phototrophicaceae bacterium]